MLTLSSTLLMKVRNAFKFVTHQLNMMNTRYFHFWKSLACCFNINLIWRTIACAANLKLCLLSWIFLSFPDVNDRKWVWWGLKKVIDLHYRFTLATACITVTVLLWQLLSTYFRWCVTGHYFLPPAEKQIFPFVFRIKFSSFQNE